TNPRPVDEIEPLEVELSERRDHLLDDPGEVVAAEAAVAGGGPDLHDAFVLVENRDVEGAAAEIEDEIFAFRGFAETIGQGGGRRLVDQALDVETGKPAGVDRRLALVIVEIGWNGDDDVGHGLPEMGFRVLLEGTKDELGQLFRAVRLLPEEDLLLRAHQPLE